MAVGMGSPGSSLSEKEIRDIVARGIPREVFAGKKILVLTPDSTRTAPLPLMLKILIEKVAPSTARLDFMVALGTHQHMSAERILSLYGMEGNELPPNVAFMNHRWDLPDQLRRIGTIPSEEIEELTGGLFKENVEVSINKCVFDYDFLLILGPVFPHEVVGFSGGNKYLFPGISGGEFLHFFHWLGAVMTCWKTIGFKDTPTRAVVDRAASMVSVPRWCLAMVVDSSGGLSGLYAGTPEDAWSAAADLSSKIHVVYKPKPYHTVLGRAAEIYDELWVGAKVMYKLEPVVSDGGKLIIYGPWIKEVSLTWGAMIEKIGYHVRDYFLSSMDSWKDVPRGVLAHSTHVRGVGTYVDGKETPRIDVILATGISKDVCKKINLGYTDPGKIKIEEFMNRESEGVLFVDHAGEVLHRLERERNARKV